MRDLRLAAVVFFYCILNFNLSTAAEFNDTPMKPAELQKYAGSITNGAAMSETPVDRFSNVSPLEMPRIIVMNYAERMYVTLLVGEMMKILSKRRDLEETDLIFGSGKYFWPKDPREKTHTSITFGAQNFSLRSITVDFRRKSKDQPWQKGIITIHPQNYPIGVYDMQLPKEAFKNYVFESSSSEIRPNRPVKEVNIYSFRVLEEKSSLLLRYETRQDVSSIEERFPRAFHELVIERQSD